MNFDETVDVLVVGAGQAGLVASVAAATTSATTMLIEQRDVLGGTAAKSSGAMWIPDNRFMRDAGMSDDRDSALHYMARLNHPSTYDLRDPQLGLPHWEFIGISSFFDNAHRALDALLSVGALDVVPEFDFVDYFAHLGENSAPTGRTLFPRPGHGEPTGGTAATKRLAATAIGAGVDVRLQHRVVELVLDGDAVSGVVIEDEAGRTTRVGVSGGVVFATGGFSRDPALLRKYTHLPYGPGCAVATNVGGVLPLVRSAGAELAGMDLAWGAPIVLERAQREPESVCATFYLPGDGFIIVDQRGRRVVNEKSPYNEFVRAFFTFDAHTASYPALPMIVVWDEQQHHGGAADRLGNPFLADHPDAYWIVSGRDYDELARNIATRLSELRDVVPAAALSTDFADTLAASVERYNGYAADGEDRDFARGASPYELAMAKRMGPGSGPNPAMRPISTAGPFYATLLGPAAFDTKGGPLTDGSARVLHEGGEPIIGLYAAGNCAASPTGQSYWSGGTSLALAMCFGFLAAEHAASRAGALLHRQSAAGIK